MKYVARYASPLGEITMASDGVALTGVWFAGQKHFPELSGAEEAELPVFAQTRQWLDSYFAGTAPETLPAMNLQGTAFQRAVWAQLLQIPYGQTVTYGTLAARVGMTSARAVGGAVGRNPISLLVPCHRVVGAGGKLTGYDGGLDRKEYLLKLESK